MPVLTTSLLNGFIPGRHWSLIRVDEPSGKEFKGQYRPEDYSEDASTDWKELDVPGREEGALQWVGGNSRTFSIRVTFYADSFIDNVEDRVKELRQTIAKDPKLGRPPFFLFCWGKITELVVVKGIGGIRFNDQWLDGRVKRADFLITMRIVDDPVVIVETDPTAPIHKSLHKPAVPGGTYESLAAAEYGNPMIGVILRQEGETAFPKPGDTVRLPARTYFLRMPIQPVSFDLGDSDEARAAVAAALEARSRSRRMPLVVR